MKKYYLEILTNKYADFKGRARRKEYWMYSLFQVLIGFSLYLISFIFFTNVLDYSNEKGLYSSLLLFALFLMLHFIPNIAIAQTIKQSSSKNIVPLSTDIAQLEKSIEITENITEVFITDWLAWALNNSYPLIKENFAELSINSSTNNEEHEIVDSRLKKISHGEQKILEGIERNEKLLKEILKRLDEK